MLFMTQPHPTRYAVVFEIGSGSVAGAIISTATTDKQFTILYSTREFLSLKQTLISEDIRKRLLAIFMTTALEVVTQTLKYIPPKTQISEIYVNFTAPWSNTKNFIYTVKNDEPTTVTKRLLQQVRQSVSNGDCENNDSTQVNCGLDNYTIVNRSIVNYTLNNYSIKNPVGQIGKILTINEVFAFVANSVYLPVVDIINKLFNKTNTNYLTSSLIQQRLLHTYINSPARFATIHLTYEAIEVVIYQTNQIVSTFATTIGINTLVRNLSKISKLSHEQIYSLLTTNDTSSLATELLTKIETIFEKKVEPELADFFASIQSTQILPRDFFLICTANPTPVLANLIMMTLKKIRNKLVLHNLQLPIVQNSSSTNTADDDFGIQALGNFFHISGQNE